MRTGKKISTIFISLVLLSLIVFCLYGCKKNKANEKKQNDIKKIEAVFAAIEKQLYTDSDGNKKLLDTIWIYYDDMSFDQVAELDNIMVLFSSGTYSFSDNGDFNYEPDEKDFGKIIIKRDHKIKPSEKVISEYDSTRTYNLASLGFIKIHSFNPEGVRICEIYYGDSEQPFKKTDGTTENVDTIWFYYENGTFLQYAEVNGKLELFSKGNYEFDPENHDIITICRTEKYQDGFGLKEYSSKHTYDLSKLNFKRLYP